ncbi:MAG: DUF1289 domain-containing protein [Planctomycetota bacterium]
MNRAGTQQSTVDSPCVQLCVLGPAGHCAGCGRTSEEIGAWTRASNHEKLEIRKQSAMRLENSTQKNDLHSGGT